MDEPLSNLDAKLRVQMRLQIRELQRRVGATTIYVTHDQVEAMTLADRLVVMNAGVAEQIDTPMRLYDAPASRFVAGFIGSPAMNILAAVVAPDRAGLVLPGGAVLPARALPEAGRPVLCGIRPEHLAPLAADAGAGGLALRVFALETLGADAYAHCHLDGAPQTLGEELVVRLPGHARLAPGAALRVTADPALIHLFDPETGRRIEPA
jgi:sn-glycerol 3-phosphate transport system ATP-binding protein